MEPDADSKVKRLPSYWIMAIPTTLGLVLCYLNYAVGTHPVLSLTLLISLLVIGTCLLLYSRESASLSQHEAEFIREKAEHLEAIREGLLSASGVLGKTRNRLSVCDQMIDADWGKLGPLGIKNIAAVRRILVALEQRIDDVVSLSQKRDYQAQVAAVELLNSPLCFLNSAVDTVIGNEIPQVPQDQIEVIVEFLLQQIEMELKANRKVA